MDTDTMTVSQEASADLVRWEDVIESHQAEFWKVGEALINIKIKQLWREELSGKPYKSWEDYLEKAWGYASRAKQLMQAAKLHSSLIEAGMSEEDFKRVVPNEAHAKKLSRVGKLSKEEKESFVKAISNEGGKADTELATKTLDVIRPPKIKPSPSELSKDDRKKALLSSLEKAKSAFNAKLDSVFDEYGEPETVDAWLKSFAEDILDKLSR